MLTVMMASCNGAGWIGECLQSFCALAQPEGGYKLVVIDNASTDRTADIVRSFAEKLPITLLHQPKPGKNRALNMGLGHVEGDLVIFTDDDVIVAPDWLIEWRKAADQHPDYDIFGGRILPYWRKQPPDWLMEAINPAMVYALTGEAHVDGPISPGLIFGPNMMVRARLFANGRTFDNSVGPDGTATYAMGSETTFTKSCAEDGARCMFVSSVIVQHIIRENQTEPKWIASRYFRSGRGSVYTDLPLRHQNIMLFGAPRYLWRRILEQYLSWLWAVLWFGGKSAFAKKLKLSTAQGMAFEYRRLRLRR